MSEQRGNIIVIEGAQGVGKTGMASFLRDNLSASNLYRLTGINDKSETGQAKTFRMYLNLINYMESLEDTKLNLIFDRTFFTEQVYSKLGYKEYDFTGAYERLLKKFGQLDYNIYVVFLYLKDEKIYEKRLERQHHGYQEFSVLNSVNQQSEYLHMASLIKDKNIKVIKVATDDFASAYKQVIDKIPVLKAEKIKYEGV